MNSDFKGEGCHPLSNSCDIQRIDVVLTVCGDFYYLSVKGCHQRRILIFRITYDDRVIGADKENVGDFPLRRERLS